MARIIIIKYFGPNIQHIYAVYYIVSYTLNRKLLNMKKLSPDLVGIYFVQEFFPTGHEDTNDIGFPLNLPLL